MGRPKKQKPFTKQDENALVTLEDGEVYVEDTNANMPNMPKSVNTRYIEHSAQIGRLPKLTLEERQNPQIVEERCQLYLDLCARDGMKASLVGLACALGVKRRSLLYAKQEARWGKETAAVLERYQELIDLELTNLAMDGKIHFSYAQFLQKNNSGYTDKSELIIGKEEATETRESLIEKAKALGDAIPAEYTEVKDEDKEDETEK